MKRAKINIKYMKKRRYRKNLLFNLFVTENDSLSAVFEPDI